LVVLVLLFYLTLLFHDINLSDVSMLILCNVQLFLFSMGNADLCKYIFEVNLFMSGCTGTQKYGGDQVK